MKAHLLYSQQDFNFVGELPLNHEDLSQDLELSTLFESMAQGDKFLLEVARRVVLTSLGEPEAIIYRQHILADCIDFPEMTREIYAIAVKSITERRGLWGHKSSRFPSSILSSAVQELEMFVGLLKQLRSLADSFAEKVHSEGLRSLFRSLQVDLDDDYFAAIDNHLKQLRFKDGVLMSAELYKDNSGINYALCSPWESKVRGKERIGIGPRTVYTFTVPPRDEAGANALSDLSSRGINIVANAAAQSADHIESYFSLLRAELGFYVGCLNLRDQLEAKGEPTCFPIPVTSNQPHLTFSDLRDVSLALRAENPIIGNDVHARGKMLVIITGANSGGKSTFLRSVGMAQLMMQCGMFVAAESYRAGVSNGIFTHFIREEDASMRSGRLDEELSRMSAVTDLIRSNSLMLFNESFAATNEREGSEIARQIVRALIHAEVRVFFVTHQFDFAESFLDEQQSDFVLFLRAERDANGRRNFKLVERDPLSTSYGEDIYKKVFLEFSNPN